MELLNNQRLINQFANLERSVARGGKSTVDHPRNAHDDIANAAAGALVKTIPLSVGEFVFTGIKMGEGSSTRWDTSPIPEGTVDHFRYRFAKRSNRVLT